jgi:predicted MFS family arabinose efflux permease
MKIKLNSLWAKVCSILIILFSLGVVIYYFDFFNFYPFLGDYTIENSLRVTVNNNDEMIILNNSGLNIIGVNSQSEMTFFKKGNAPILENFNKAFNVCCDSDDNIYIQNNKNSIGAKLSEESILKFDKNGNFLKTIFEKKHPESVINNSIRKIFAVGNEFYYLIDDYDGFYIYNSSNKKIKTFEFRNARLYNLNYEVSDDLKSAIVLTKRGEFVKVKENDNSELIYNACTPEYSEAVPIYFKVLPDERIIYSDIGERKICSFNPKTNTKEILIDKSEKLDEILLYYNFYVKENKQGKLRIVATGSGEILDWNNGKENYHSSAKYSRKIIIEYSIFCTCVFFIALAIVWFIIFIAKKIILSKSLVIKVCTFVMIGIAVITAVFSLISFSDFNERMINETLNKARVASLLVSSNIPYKSFENITNNYDFMNNDYKNLRNSIKDIFSEKNNFIKDFYCTTYKITNNNSVVSIVFDTTETCSALYPSFSYNEEVDEYEIMKTQESKNFVTSTSGGIGGIFVFVLAPIVNNDGVSIGLVEVGTNLDSLEENNRNLIVTIFLNIFSIAIFVILIFLEISKFITGRKLAESKISETSFAKVAMNNEMSHMLVFLIYFSTNIVSGFAALYAFSIAPENQYLHKEFMISIPIIAETVFSIFSSFLGPKLTNTFGKRKIAVFSSILFTAGMILKIIFPSIWFLSLGNAVSALGWGSVFAMINSDLSQEGTSEIFSDHNSSMHNGIICGIILGSFLINWINYFAIYLISAIVSISAMYFIISYIYDNKNVSEIKSESKENSGSLFSSKVIYYFLFSLMPIIVCSSFVEYMLPLEGNRLGLKDSLVGYVYMINGLCVILLGNFLTNFLSKKIKIEYSIILGTVLHALAFFIFSKYQTVPILIFDVLIIGIAQSFMSSMQSEYYSGLPSVKKAGPVRSNTVHTVIGNLAQIIGSIAFSFIFTIGSQGIFILGIVILIAGTGFLLANLKKIKSKKLSAG